MTDRVECRSDFTYPQRPIVVHWGEQRLEVDHILGMWKLPAGQQFLVSTSDRHTFNLFYNETQDTWQVDPVD